MQLLEVFQQNDFVKRTYRKKTDHGSCVSAIDLKGACQGVQHSTKNPMAPQRKGGEKPRLQPNGWGGASVFSFASERDLVNRIMGREKTRL